MQSPTVQRSEAREQHQCRRKIRYDNKRLAEAAAQSTRSKYGRHLMIGAYHCPFCGGWHVGNDMPKRQRTEYKKQKREESKRRRRERRAMEGEE